MSNVSYDNKDLTDAFNQSENQPGVRRTQVNVDMFGFYWPLSDLKSMHGFVINGVSDQLTDNVNNRISVNNYLLAYSYHKFFGTNIGDGWYLRGDVGLSYFVVQADVSGFGTLKERSEMGLGVLGGGGYSFAIGEETRMLIGLYLTVRRAEEERANYGNFSLGFLF
jgi:hypothetical protein